jgi:signal transduction histidine kinase
VEDVTETNRLEEQRRELEFQLWRAQKLEAVGQMTAGIAHDFNNLLSIIRGSCDMLALAMDGETGRVKDYVENIRVASYRGAAMIQKLLGFSRTAQLALAPTDLAALVDDMESMLRAILPAHVKLALRGRAGSVAPCDPGAVEEMVLNLVTNARDAMPGGGTIRLTVEPWATDPDEETRPSWMPPGAYVRVAVEDTGTGMCDATKARALEPFFTTKAAGAGTGLGLPMVYGLAKQQAGFLDLASEPGAGTTVSLYFPRVVD